MKAKELAEYLMTHPDDPVVFWDGESFVNVEGVACNPTTYYVVVLNPNPDLQDKENHLDYFRHGDPAMELIEYTKEEETDAT